MEEIDEMVLESKGHWKTFWEAREYGNPSVVGSSTWAPKGFLFVFRTLVFIVTTCILLYITFVGSLSFEFLTFWVLALSALAYGLASLACVIRMRWLAIVTTISYHTIFSYSFHVTIFYWIFGFPNVTKFPGVITLTRLYPHGGTFAIYAIDLFICGQLEFRLLDILWSVAFGIVYIAWLFIWYGATGNIVYHFLDWREVGLSRTVIAYLLNLLMAPLFAFIMIILSRTTRVYRKKSEIIFNGSPIR